MRSLRTRPQRTPKFRDLKQKRSQLRRQRRVQRYKKINVALRTLKESKKEEVVICVQGLREEENDQRCVRDYWMWQLREAVNPVE